MTTCPTCSQKTDKNAEALIKARIATRPDAGPAQARHIVRLEQRVAELTLVLTQRGSIRIVNRSERRGR